MICCCCFFQYICSFHFLQDVWSRRTAFELTVSGQALITITITINPPITIMVTIIMVTINIIKSNLFWSGSHWHWLPVHIMRPNKSERALIFSIQFELIMEYDILGCWYALTYVNLVGLVKLAKKLLIVKQVNPVNLGDA